MSNVVERGITHRTSLHLKKKRREEVGSQRGKIDRGSKERIEAWETTRLRDAHHRIEQKPQSYHTCEVSKEHNTKVNCGEA